MVGVAGATRFEKVYENPNGKFILWATGNHKAYGSSVNRNNDRIFRIQCGDYYAFETDDLGQMIYWLLVNKQLVDARWAEFEKLAKYIIRAFGPTPIPKLPVCHFTSCLPCPLFVDGHCESPSAKFNRILTGGQQ